MFKYLKQGMKKVLVTLMRMGATVSVWISIFFRLIKVFFTIMWKFITGKMSRQEIGNLLSEMKKQCSREGDEKNKKKKKEIGKMSDKEICELLAKLKNQYLNEQQEKEERRIPKDS